MSSVETFAALRTFDVPDRFELRRLLGRGGMGAVHEAFDHERGELVALKHLARLDPIGVARIKHEFRVLSGLWHPNLVSLYELFEHEGRFFFTMELVEGVSFLRWVRPSDTAADDAHTRPSGTEVLTDE